MWQPTWSPHPPQGALHGQQVGTPSNPLQGLQQNTIASQPMTQTQWMGPSSGPHGCPPGSMASPVLGPASFPGPCGQHPSNFSSSLGPPASGHQGSGFAVQCKHHQGCHSSMQNQQLMMGSNTSSASPPLGFGPGSQHGGYSGTTWPTFSAQQQSSPLPPQALHHHDASMNPIWQSTCIQPSPTSFLPSQPNLSNQNQNQPKPCIQNNPLLGQVAPGLQVPQGPQSPQAAQVPPALPHQPIYPGPPALQAHQVPQGPQMQQGDQSQQLPATMGQLSNVPTSTPTSNAQLVTPNTTTPPTQGVQPPSTNPSNLDLQALDLQALEQRLGATLEKSMEKSMESMAASLKSTLASPPQVPPTTTSTTPTSISPKPSTTIPTTAPSSTPVKAKPPTPPTDSSQQQQPSKNSQRSPLTREKRSSRRSRSRRRRRSRSKELPKTRHHDSASKKGHFVQGHKGHESLSSKKRHAPDWHNTPSYPQTAHTLPASGRERNHPVFRRSNTFHRVHQDDRSTVYKKEPEKRDNQRGFTPRSTSPSHPKETMISLKSRSRTRGPPTYQSNPRSYPAKPVPVTLRPKPGRKTKHGWDPEVSASETAPESIQLDIPHVEIEEVDWRRPSQERDDEDEQDGLDDMMPIPTHKPMDEDWGISVKKAFDDTSRTKAPCEIPATDAIVLPTTISQRAYNNFAATLRQYNPRAPLTVIENMASIFAHSGKMTPDQAKGSYTFAIRSMELYGLFVPTDFKARPPFDGNDSNVYHIIHGTTTNGASTILAEELIRPGDFTIHKDYAKCQYPSYGFYSAGEIAAKTCPFSSSIEELSRKILKIGKGTLPVHIGGIYTGRHAHSNQQAGGNDEVQRLCGKVGVARGKEKYTVARSEHTTVVGVILYYKNQLGNG